MFPPSFGKLSIETFLAEYWQKKPLLIRNAFKDFEPLISADELAGLACEEEVESRIVIQNPDSDAWELRHGPFSEEAFGTLPNSHWTLLVQAVDHWVPEAKALLSQFYFAPSWRVDDLMISYATDGGGVGPHYDNYDVFLIQAEGQRRWEVGGLFGEASPRREGLPVMILPEFEPDSSFVLNPGDMLYLPPRVGHNGIAVGDGCVTYSVGFRAPSHQEILTGFTDFVTDQLPSEFRYADPELKPVTNPGEIDAEALARVRQIFTQYLNQPGLLEDWFGQYVTEPKYPDQQPELDETMAFSMEELTQYFAAGEMLQKTAHSRFAYRRGEGNETLIYVNGELCELPPEQYPFAQALCDNEVLQQQDLIDAESLEVVLELLNGAALEPVEPEDDL